MRAEPAPPSARPAQWRGAARASPPPGSVTAGGSRNLATPRPRLRRGRRADAKQPQNGGGGASGGESRSCQTPFSHPLPRLHCSGVTIPARRNPEPHPKQSRGSRLTEAGRGTQPLCKKEQNQHRPSTFTSPQQYPKGDVPQRPPRINCAHWTPSSAKRAALATDPSGHEEASIREAIPSK